MSARETHRLAGVLSRPEAIFYVLAIAVAIRLIGIGEWSLWEDEEGSLYFAQYLWKKFAQAFPLFFQLLAVLEAETLGGRLVASFFGVVSIYCTYRIAVDWLSRPAAVLAALLLAVCLGHVFWSQSIRYYTMVLAFDAVGIYLLESGLRTASIPRLILAAEMLLLAMLAHFSAILVIPALIAYLVGLRLFGLWPEGVNRKCVLAFALPLGIGATLLAARFFHELHGGGALPTSDPVASGPIYLITRLLAYYGAPMVGLACIAPLFMRRYSPQLVLLAMCVGFVPIMELLVLDHLKLAIALWYHGFVSCVGLAILAGLTLVGVYETGFRRSALVFGLGTVLYYGVFLGLYYTEMHGDRPRWREAVETLKKEHLQWAEVHETPTIRATVPAVVAHYLGENDSKRSKLVAGIPTEPAPLVAGDIEWHVVKVSHVSAAYHGWYRHQCERRANYLAHTGPVDRSVSIYRCAGVTGEGMPPESRD